MRISHAPVLFLSLASVAFAARSTATSFCKCICFNNSTIIALNPPSSTSSPAHLLEIRDRPILGPRDVERREDDSHHKLSCNDCTRAFCLDYNLPICKNAKEEDVFTTCFQRDSIKDEAVVIIFIIMTASLLGWAAVKPFVERLRAQGSIPTSTSGGAPGVSGAPSRNRSAIGPGAYSRVDGGADEDRDAATNRRSEDEDIGLMGRR